ncbi:hypothetical protein ALQ54_04269 [Pseudomonas syringae]|uniref:DUF1652 domain-containing protein n=1 Tax=Pseudomonas syringae TaxID=317 RepID=UPI000EFB8BAE|nr:DUF1652 domain-containing protein [Pseudomonas syringae]RMN71411.1 hypothetical protein ALQ54_04269 [Pseudomonas syringae]
MISNLDLKHIVESAFFPMKCVCTISPYHTMTLQILDEQSADEEFTVIGVDTAPLTSMRAVVDLMHELKAEMKLRQVATNRQVSKSRKPRWG